MLIYVEQPMSVSTKGSLVRCENVLLYLTRSQDAHVCCIGNRGVSTVRENFGLEREGYHTDARNVQVEQGW